MEKSSKKTHKHKVSRVLFSHIFAVGLVLFMVLCKPHTHNYGNYIISQVMTFIGFFLVFLGCLGRVASGMFLGKKRARSLVKEGFYSIVRNPLYVFSFSILVGILLIYGSFVVMLVVITIFILYYTHIIKREEAYLEKNIEGYIDYKKEVPRIIPKFSLWKAPETYDTDTKVVINTMKDSIGFFALSIIPYIVISLQKINTIPSLITIY